MEHDYSSYIRRLHGRSDQKHIESRKLIQKLDRQYQLLDEARFVGFGWEPHTAAIRETLAELATNLDLWGTSTRKILNDCWNSLPGETKAAIRYDGIENLPHPTLKMEYSEERKLFTVVLPEMLPGRRPKGVNYLHDQVVANMCFFQNSWYEVHGKYIYIIPAAVVFIHCIGKGAERQVKDYDNTERKRVLDALQITGMFNDHPTHIIDMNMMARTEESCTIIHITRLERLFHLLASLDYSVYQEFTQKELEILQTFIEGWLEVD